ncbi:hypothetical protein FKM82_009918 [Ascaphus truei]
MFSSSSLLLEILCQEVPFFEILKSPVFVFPVLKETPFMATVGVALTFLMAFTIMSCVVWGEASFNLWWGLPPKISLYGI